MMSFQLGGWKTGHRGNQFLTHKLCAGFFMEISHADFPSGLAGKAALQQLMVVLHVMCRFDVLVTPDDTLPFTILLNR